MLEIQFISEIKSQRTTLPLHQH